MVAFACGETKRMTIMRALTIGVVVALAASAPAFAGGKGGGGKQAGSDRPTENSSFNYGKVEHTYAEKNKASPSLLKKVNTGKHINKTSN
jgi:hypothetical protein